MKKKFLIVLVLILSLFLTACGSNNLTTDKDAQKMQCVLQTTVSTGVSIESEYNVEHDGSYVSLVETVEKLTSSDSEYLTTYKEKIEEIYEPFKNIEYYDYNIDISGDTLTSVVRIDYSKVDTDKLLAIDSSLEQLIKNGRIRLADIKDIYEQLGAVCH